LADWAARGRFGRIASWRNDVAALLFSYLGLKYYVFGLDVRRRARWRRYDFCHATDAMSLCAARGFARRGIPVLLDVNEIPDPFERQGAHFTTAAPAVKRRLAHAFARDLPMARAIVATSDAMADFVTERYGREAATIRNARRPLAAPPSAAIRADAGGGHAARVLVYPCTAAPHLGVETSIAMLAMLPENYRLVFVGRFVTPAYRETIERLIRRHGLERRVFMTGELPEAAYLPYLAGADIGLVPLSFAYRNQQLVLPWRAVDLAAAQVPMVATPSEALRRLARERDIGEIASGTDAAALVAAVEVLAASPASRLATIKRDLHAVAVEHAPERESARYREIVTQLATRRTGRAAFVVNLALRANRRVIGFVDQVCALGWDVDLYCVRAPDRALFQQPERVRCIAVADRLLPRGFGARWRRLPAALAAPFLGIGMGLLQLSRARRFARAVPRRGDWDIVVATDIFALPAGLAAARPGSFLVYDATEIPDLRQRTSPVLRRIPAPLRLAFRRWERAYLRRAGLVFAPSRALADYLRRRYRRRVAVRAIRNAAEKTREAVRGRGANGLRERLGLPVGDIVLVSPCGISAETGALAAARALRFLPADHVLVFIGRFSHATVESQLRAALRRDRTEHRCFFLPELDYPTYLAYLAECDVGLVLFDTAVANMRLSAPNRFFDLLAAGVPMVSTPIPEIATILHRHGIGGIVEERRPAAVARAILDLRERLGIGRGGAIDPRIRGRLERVARHHRADKEMARAVATLENNVGPLAGKRVALLTLRSAFSNRRFLRMATALRASGAAVAGFDTDIGRPATTAAQPDWLATIAIR
jgi:glycosyltransferase involved in cell wall biosynthesis